MSWVTLTDDDLMSSMTARERDLFGTSVTSDAGGTPDGPADRVVPLLADVVAEVRMQVASYQGNTLDADTGKIPEGCRANALALGRWRLLATMPNYEPSKAREMEYQAAMRFFEKVAEGKIKPLPSEDAEANPNPPANSAEVVSSTLRRGGRTNMEGL